MWKPTNVVPQHRQRATLVWGGLIVAAVGYTAWQIGVMAVKRRNPSTSIALSNDNFQFPEVTICFYDGYGCGFVDHSTDGCATTAKNFSYALVHDGSPTTSSSSQYFSGDTFVFAKESEYPNCVAFDLSRLEIVNSDQSRKPTAILSMYWVSSDNATAEINYSSSVDVFIGGEADGVEYTSVPYSRNLKPSTEESFEETAMTIGKTHRKYISKDATTTYPVLTLSTTNYVTTRGQYSLSSTDSASYFESTIPTLTDQYAVGSLRLAITQGSYSLTEVKDIDPLEIGTLLGSIGGFWELLVLTWGICFIANSRGSEPTMKGRNFSKSLQRGSSKVIRKKRKLGPPSTPTHHDDQRPQWDNVCISSDSESGEQSGRFHQQRSTIRASYRKPVVQPQPKRARDSSPCGGATPSSSSHHGGGDPLTRCATLPCSSHDAMERGFSRRASDDCTPTRWADMPRGPTRSTGIRVSSTASIGPRFASTSSIGTRVDDGDGAGGVMTTTTTAPSRSSARPASIGGTAKVYSSQEFSVARSGFFARRSPSADSLDGLPEEAEAISDMDDSYNDRESRKCRKYGVGDGGGGSGRGGGGGGGGGRESSQGTMVGRNATTVVAPSRHWVMPTDSPMESSGRSTLRGASFAHSSIAYGDAQV